MTAPWPVRVNCRSQSENSVRRQYVDNIFPVFYFCYFYLLLFVILVQALFVGMKLTYIRPICIISLEFSDDHENQRMVP